MRRREGCSALPPVRLRVPISCASRSWWRRTSRRRQELARLVRLSECLVLGVSLANAPFVHAVNLALLAGAAALIAGAIFVALRAPGRVESETNAGRNLLTTAAPARVS